MNEINKNFVFHSNAFPSFSTTISSISRHHYFFPYYSPPLVHLHPQTFGHHFNNSKTRVELIDGYLIKQKMVNGTHSNVTLAIIYFLMRAATALGMELYIYTEKDVFIPSRQDALERLLEIVKSTQSPDNTSSSSSSSSPARSKSSKSTNSSSNSAPSPSSKKANYRPDISVYDVRPQEMKDGKLKSIKPPLMVFEVTSDNRVTDLTKKWTNYRRANIPEYVIVDRDQTHEQSSDYSPSVIVGKLGKSWSLAPSGDPAVSAKSNRNVSHHAEHQMYPREVYKVNDPRVVDCSFIKMTAQEMLAPGPLVECIKKDIEEARKTGKEEGRKIGKEEGRKIGKAEGRKIGKAEGRKIGEEEGRKIGKAEGRKIGKAEGRKIGEEEGRKIGKAEGRKIGEEEGRKRGEEEGRKREKEEARKREEEARKRGEEEGRKRGEEEGRKREKEEGRKREEALKKEIDVYKKNQDVYKKNQDVYKRERDELLKKLKASEAKPNEPLVNKSKANGHFSPRKRERRNSSNSYSSGSSLAAKSSNGSAKGNKRA